MLPTDAILFEDPSFKVKQIDVLGKPVMVCIIVYFIFYFFNEMLHTWQVYAEKYAVDQEAFFKDYAEAHAKLSNLGAKFDPPEVC